jgi:hypothetical protein
MILKSNQYDPAQQLIARRISLALRVQTKSGFIFGFILFIAGNDVTEG